MTATNAKPNDLVSEPGGSAATELDQPGPEARGGGGAVELDPGLAEALGAWIARWLEPGSTTMETDLQALEMRHGGLLYSELLHTLARLRFPGGPARSHWQEIMALRERMSERLGEPVDVRVALTAYFIHLHRKTGDPQAINLQLIEQTGTPAFRDPLTGLHNERYFSESLELEILRAARSNQPMSVVMVDLDHFGDYNERHGEEAGNLVLAEVVRRLSASLRSEDVLARRGGEDFAVILPVTPKSGARLVAERARAAIEAADIPHEGNGPLWRVTVSLGIATFPGDAPNAAGLLRCAERALLMAKASGRNAVAIHGGDRRSFYRIVAAIPGRCRSMGESVEPFTTLNVSEGGIAFMSSRATNPGTLIEVELDLPGTERTVSAAARVVRSVPVKGGGYECSARILHLETEDRLAYLQAVNGLR